MTTILKSNSKNKVYPLFLNVIDNGNHCLAKNVTFSHNNVCKFQIYPLIEEMKHGQKSTDLIEEALNSEPLDLQILKLARMKQLRDMRSQNSNVYFPFIHRWSQVIKILIFALIPTDFFYKYPEIKKKQAERLKSRERRLES